MNARLIVVGIAALVAAAFLVPVASASTVEPNPRIRFGQVVNPTIVTPNPRIRFGALTPNLPSNARLGGGRPRPRRARARRPRTPLSGG